MTLTMLEAAGYLGWISAAVLFAAGTAWLKLGHGPLLKRLNGRQTLNPEHVESASRVLAAAVGLSAVAALLALAGRMFG